MGLELSMPGTGITWHQARFTQHLNSIIGKPASAMKPDNVFINYSHPAEQSDKRNRQEVASYIGTHYRNRSRPAARRQKSVKRPGRDAANDDRKTSELALRSKPKSPQVLSWCLRSDENSPLRSHDMHGLKVDPFSSYPIPASNRLPEAIEYFLEAFGPTHLIRSNVSIERPANKLLQNYIQYAMQNAVMFESVITVAFANMNIQRWTDGQPDVETARHYGSTLSRLRQSLATQDGIQQDATILAILALISAEYLIGNANAYRAHIRALSQIIHHRGGLELIGWQEITKPIIAGLVAQCKFCSKTLSRRLRNLHIEKSETMLTEGEFDQLTPRVPLGLRGAPLPAGLQPLALDGRMSDEMVLLARAALRNPFIDHRHGNPASRSAITIELTEYVEYVVGLNNMTLTEEVLLMSLHRELYDLGSTERLSSLYEDIVMHWTQRSLSMLEQIDPEDAALVETFIWSAFKNGGTVVAPFLNMRTEDPSDLRYQLMIRVMDKFHQMRDWSVVQPLLLRFDPMPECMHWWHLTWETTRQEYDKLKHTALQHQLD